MSRARSSTSSCSALLFLVGCGYHAVYGHESEKLHVHLERAPVADAAAADEVVSGAREALAREGALAGGEGYPRLCIEVLRIDETSEAIVADNGSPRASATRHAVVARAWVETAPGSYERDTGDVRGEDMNRTNDTAVQDALASLDQTRAVARRLGRRLALRAIGHPTSSDSLGRDPAQLPQP